MGGKPPVVVECDPEPEPGNAGETGSSDPNGCTITGTAVLPDRTNHAGTHVTIVGASGSAITAADGTYAIEHVPPFTHTLEFRNGIFHETVPGVVCGVLMSGGNLADAPLELHAGSRLDDKLPLHLSQPPSARVVYDAWVVDRSCGPATTLDCNAYQVSDDGHVAECGQGIIAIPDDPTKNELLAMDNGEVVIGASGRYVAYGSNLDVHVLDVAAHADRKVGRLRGSSAQLHLTNDEAHLVFMDDQGNVDVVATAGSDPPLVVGTFPLPTSPTVPFQDTLLLSPDSKYAAFADPQCQVGCGLLLAGMDGSVKQLGTERLPLMTAFAPDSRSVIFALEDGLVSSVVSASVETGEHQTFSPDLGYPYSFALGGSLIVGLTGTNQLSFADSAGGDAIVTVEGMDVRATSPDGRWVFIDEGTSSDSQTMSISVFDAKTQVLTPLEPELYWHFDVVFAPDSSAAVFAVGASDQVLKRVELEPDLPVTTLGPSDTLDGFSGFSPDDRYVHYTSGGSLYLADGPSPGVRITSHYIAGRTVDWLGTTGVVTAMLGPTPFDFQTGTYLLVPPGGRP
jgi:hypothetical protein